MTRNRNQESVNTVATKLESFENELLRISLTNFKFSEVLDMHAPKTKNIYFKQLILPAYTRICKNP